MKIYFVVLGPVSYAESSLQPFCCNARPLRRLQDVTEFQPHSGGSGKAAEGFRILQINECQYAIEFLQSHFEYAHHVEFPQSRHDITATACACIARDHGGY